MSKLYVYAFAASSIPPFTLKGRRIRTLPMSGIHVIADSAMPPDDATEEMLRRQHAIVEAIAARADAVLPARAGSAIDAEELRVLVARKKDALQAALDLVTGREQMTLRLPGVPVTPPPQVDDALTGTAYLEARRAAGIPAADVLGLVRSLVAGLVHDERIQAARGALPAAVFHLIERGQSAAYRERIDSAGALAGARPQVTGPWPPFAFTPELLG